MRTNAVAMSLAALAASACAESADLPRELAGANPDRGRDIIEKLGCAACHDVPGIDWPKGRVGGALAGFAGRPMIAGRLPNQSATLVQWLRDAPSLAPDTGMPPQPQLSNTDARDVAAFLYTLK